MGVSLEAEVGGEEGVEEGGGGLGIVEEEGGEF